MDRTIPRCSFGTPAQRLGANDVVERPPATSLPWLFSKYASGFEARPQGSHADLGVHPPRSPAPTALLGTATRLAWSALDLVRFTSSKDELQRLSHAHRALYRCGRTLALAAEERTLVDAFCGALVQSGDYGFAWIGYVGGSVRSRMRLVAQAGRAARGLAAALIEADNDPECKSACHLAYDSGQPVRLPDLSAASDELAPWAGAALRQRHRSAILLPLSLDATPLGILGVLSGTTGAFDAGESQLFVELAQDFASCVRALRARAAAARAMQRQREESEREIRSRLAATLHDGASQTLLAVNLGLRQMRATAQRGETLEHVQLDQLVATSGKALDELRAISCELHPATLERLSFTAAVCLQCSESAEQTGIPVHFHPEETAVVLSDRTKLQCLLALREALRNALRHAQAGRIDVYLRARPRGMLTLVVVDDGVGLASRQPGARRTGLGLTILRERIADVQGRVDLRSRSGRGTLVRIRVPLSLGATPCQ